MRRIHQRPVCQKSLKNYYRAFENMLNTSVHKDAITLIMTNDTSILSIDKWDIELGP